MPIDRHGQWWESRDDAGWDILPPNGIPNRRDAERRLFQRDRDQRRAEAERNLPGINAALRPGARTYRWSYIHGRVMQDGPRIPNPEPQPAQIIPNGLVPNFQWGQPRDVNLRDLQIDPGPVEVEQEANPDDQIERMMMNLGRRPRRAEAGRPDRNTEHLVRFPALDTKKLGVGPSYNRGVELQPFKVDYDSIEQIDQKLMHSVILLDGWPFYVAGTFCKDGRFGLLLSNDTERPDYKWIYLDDVRDLRSAAPGYISGPNNQTYWMHRTPERQNRQGMDHRNTFLKPAGKGQDDVIGAQQDMLMTGLRQRKNVPFQPNLESLFDAGVFSSLRLSNNLAIHRVKNKGTGLGVEYVGRPLGLIIGGRCKVFDHEDLQPSWILKDCAEVNLEMVP